MFAQPGWEVKIEIWPNPPEEPHGEAGVPVPPPSLQEPVKPKKPSRRTVVSDDDPIVEIIDNNAPKHKSKKKQRSDFSDWMLGTEPAPRGKPAGKRDSPVTDRYAPDKKELKQSEDAEPSTYSRGNAGSSTQPQGDTGPSTRPQENTGPSTHPQGDQGDQQG